MKTDRGFLVHLGLLVVAIVFAMAVWTRDKKAAPSAQTDVMVWSGRKADVDKIIFEGKNKKVTLEAKQDKLGRYYVGTSVRESAQNPDAGPEPAAAKTATFVSVASADKVLDLVAPLRAMRGIGRIGEDRATEFGLDNVEATLTVTIRGTEHKLEFGGPTPGGADRYARMPASGEVYAVKGDVYRNLDTAETSLLERDLHEWKDIDVAKATVTVGDKTRELVRGGPEGKKFWADPAAADQNDETAGNWMTKLDRLKPSEYADAAPDPKEVVARVEYGSNARSLGFLELVKGPAGPSGKPDYYVLTEWTRLYGKVPTSLAEQVEQDVGAVVK